MDYLMYEGILILMELRGYVQIGQTQFMKDGRKVEFADMKSVADYALNSGK